MRLELYAYGVTGKKEPFYYSSLTLQLDQFLGGRSKVIEQEGFLRRFQMVVSRIGEEGISRRQAARELNIGYATLKRLLDANLDSPDEEKDNDDRQHSLPSQLAPKEGLVMVCP